jgi:hypothetical protein
MDIEARSGTERKNLSVSQRKFVDRVELITNRYEAKIETKILNTK